MLTHWCGRYLDPEQIQTAMTLARLPSKVGKLPPNQKLTAGIAKFLGALRDVALDRMAADWGEGEAFCVVGRPE
jgi:hypothetical protein